MTIRIVTDTNVNLPSEIIDRFRILLVPAIVVFGDQAFKEGVEIDTSQVIERLKGGAEFPRTSQPPPHDFERAYRAILTEEPEATILSIHLTGAQSGTVRSAEQAGDVIRSEFPSADIRIFDTNGFSIAQGLMVREAAALAELGATAEAIIEKLRAMRDKIQLFFVLDTLDYVHKGGRLGRAAHLVGSLLNIKAVLTFREGELEAFARFRTMQQALDKLADLVGQAAEGVQSMQISVGYAIRKEEAQRLAEELQVLIQPDVMIFQEIGPALAVYTGPGAVGVAWYGSNEPAGAKIQPADN